MGECTERMWGDMIHHYLIGGHHILVKGKALCTGVDLLPGFIPFHTEVIETETLSFEETKEEVPTMQKVQYTLEHEDVKIDFGKTDKGHLIVLTSKNDRELYVWTEKGSDKAMMKGNFTPCLLRFGLWVGYGLLTLHRRTIAIHSSCIVYKNKAVLFLGESGTGKSTHTRLWKEYITGASLLNDDSPLIRIEGEKVYVYGSPWSGKTPCYKQERYELKGCVRLSQAPYNRIEKLSILQAYGAIHPSCPPEFAYDDKLYDEVSEIIGHILLKVPCYHLACLPDKKAVQLSSSTIFDE